MRSLAAAAAFSFGAVTSVTHEVAIRDNAFDPPTLTVAVNETVRWTNRGRVPHTVKFEDRDSSTPIPVGLTHSDSFDRPGTYPYTCEIHSEMAGTVVVRASSTSSSTSTTRPRSSTTSTTEDPLGSSVTAPPDSTTTSTAPAEESTTTSTTTESQRAATRVTDSDGDSDENVDAPAGIAAVLLLLTAAGALARTRGGFR